MKSERLGLHHFSVHVKMGFAKEYLDEMIQKMKPGGFDPETGQILILSKLLSGFFWNLVAALDNLTHEINVIVGLGLSKSSAAELFGMIEKWGNKAVPDRRISKLPRVLLEDDTFKNVRRIQGYRNFLGHSRVPPSMTTVTVSVKMAISSPISQPPQGPPVASLASSSIRFPPRDPGRAGSDAGPTSVETPLHVEWHLPKLESIDLLPSQTKESDLDPDDVAAICQDLYLWTIDFLDKVYENLIKGFKALP